MKMLFTTLLMLLPALLMRGQLPQFSPYNYFDWVYNNPNIGLDQDNILGNRIVLYVSSDGYPLTLTSPTFDSHAGQVIDMDVTWVTKHWQHEDFVVARAGLTAALINSQGVAIDSVTFTPTQLGRENHLNLSLRVSHTVPNARLRFASWKADVISSGAVRQIVMNASFPADVNLDGEVSLADINAIIAVIAGENGDPDLVTRADVNRDGEVSLADINAVIDAIVA